MMVEDAMESSEENWYYLVVGLVVDGTSLVEVRSRKIGELKIGLGR